VVGMLVNIILARLLVPADFGVVALVLGFVGILQTFAELGTSVALVQRPDIDNDTIDSAFVSTCVMTGSVVVLLYCGSSGIAAFFDLPVMEGVIRIVAVSYLFRGLFALYRCLLLREMRYREISLISFAGYSLYGCFAVLFACLGFKAFSIAWAQLVWSFFLLVMGVAKTGYLPRGFGQGKIMWQLVSFGFWVSFGRLLRNTSGKLDTLIVGKLLNAELLGGYDQAQRLVMLLPQTYTQIVDQVMLPIYAAWHDDAARVERGYWKVLSHSAILLTPTVALLFVFAEPMVLILFGEKWSSVVPLVRIMSVCGLMKVLGDGVFDSVVLGTGKPQIITWINICRMVTMPLVLVVGCQRGIDGVAWGISLYSLVGRGVGQWLLHRYYGYSWRRYWSEIGPVLFAALAATLAAVIALRSAAPALWSLRMFVVFPAIVGGWSLLYVAMLWGLSRERLYSVVKIVSDRLSRLIVPCMKYTMINKFRYRATRD